MEDLANLSPARIEALASSDQSNPDEGRPRRNSKLQVVAKNTAPPPPIDVEEEVKDRHKLDERA